MKKWTTEAKVGLFTIIGIVLFGVCIAFVGRVNLFSPPQMKITGHFQSVAGLKEGNAVKYSGVSVGYVKSLSVSDKGVTVVMDIKDGTKIPVDSEFSLSSDGVIGEKFVAVTPGHSTKYLHTGDTVEGQGLSDLDKTLKTADTLMKEANKVLGSINNIIGDKETQDSLRNALRSTDQIAQNTIALTGQMNAMLADNSQNIHEITSQMAQLSRNMNGITSQLNTQLQQFNADGNAGTEMRSIVNNLQTTTESLSKMAKSMEGVVTDPQAEKDIKETLHNTAQLTTKLNKLTGGDVGGTTTTGKKSEFRAQTSVEMLYNGKEHRYSPNADVALFVGDSIFTLGAQHIGDGATVNLTYGKWLNDQWSLRGGLFDGQAGFGLDYGLGGPITISAALFNPNELTYRLRTEYNFRPGLYGVWQFEKQQHQSGLHYVGLKQAF